MSLFTPTSKQLFTDPNKKETVDDFLKGLAQKESSGNYKAMGPVINNGGMYQGDQAIGKYQIMGKNVPEWSKKYLGVTMNAQQFLANPNAQDNLMKARAQELFNKYGNWGDVASAHFTGQPLKKAGNAKDQLGTTAPKYVQDVLSFMRGDSSAKAYQSPLLPSMSSTTPAVQNQDLWSTFTKNVADSPFVQYPLKTLNFVGETIDKGFGLPARLGGAIGSKLGGGTFNSTGIPETMSGQLEDMVGNTTGSPLLGATAGVLGSLAQPFPGPGKLTKAGELGNLTTKILSKLEGKTSVAKQFISDLTNMGDIKQVERDLIRKALDGESNVVNVPNFIEKVKDQLLPLNIKSSGYIDVTMRDGQPFGTPKGEFKPRYESISLPYDLKGNVKNYREQVYESPIKTSAGDNHFGGTTKNYFGHTRIEDMADNQTRRVIEVQSDLYQKGNLEKELDKKGKLSWQNEEVNKKLIEAENKLSYYKKFADETTNSKQKIASQQKLVDSLSSELGLAKSSKSEVAKLAQYNNPTAHFRMAREEIQKAAQEGKTKLQFPTGETAMKIEGLGEVDTWALQKDGKYLTGIGTRGRSYQKYLGVDGGMEVGQEISKVGGRNDDWIITDVLGDGKFKAVPKQVLDKHTNPDMDLKERLDYLSDVPGGDRMVETFDISGKVDTNNPIYKFYDKEMSKYLKNNYGAKEVTDAQGVKWMEVDLNSSMGKKPIEAFALGGLIPAGYEQQKQSQENQNQQNKNQLNPFLPGFLSNTQTVNKIQEPNVPGLNYNANRPENSMNMINSVPVGSSVIAKSNIPGIPSQQFGGKRVIQGSDIKIVPDKPFQNQKLEAAPKTDLTSLLNLPHNTAKSEYYETPKNLQIRRAQLAEQYDPKNDEVYNSLSKNPQVVSLYKKYFPNVEMARMMRTISLGESEGKQIPGGKRNRNGTIDHGIFQLNSGNREKNKFGKYVQTEAQWKKGLDADLEKNFKEAAKLIKIHGYRAWDAYRNGKHEEYLSKV